MSMVKFSIVVPSLNQNQFICRALDSICLQKGDFSIECIVVDGESDDGTVDSLIEYELKIKKTINKFNQNLNFRWISEKDNGQSDAINKGLKMTSGDILAYLNSDDSYVAGVFARVSESFKKNPQKKWLTGYCNIINQDDVLVRNLVAVYKNFWLKRYSYNKLLVLNFISQPSTFWKKEILSDFGYFDEQLHYTMDYEYWLRIGFNNDPIILNAVLSNFRVHNNSKGETAFRKQFAQDELVARRYCRNHLLKFLHKIHNRLIILSYRLIK